jgi:hypothetical protein
MCVGLCGCVLYVGMDGWMDVGLMHVWTDRRIDGYGNNDGAVMVGNEMLG